jgi:hypothetical protein
LKHTYTLALLRLGLANEEQTVVDEFFGGET